MRLASPQYTDQELSLSLNQTEYPEDPAKLPQLCPTDYLSHQGQNLPALWATLTLPRKKYQRLPPTHDKKSGLFSPNGQNWRTPQSRRDFFRRTYPQQYSQFYRVPNPRQAHSQAPCTLRG